MMCGTLHTHDEELSLLRRRLALTEQARDSWEEQALSLARRVDELQRRLRGITEGGRP